MRAVTVLLTGLILMMALGGCGQKGPLYRDHQDASARAALEAVESAPSSSDARANKESGE